MSKSMLCIGDPHAHPEYSNDRFTNLGRFILEIKPDIVLCVGDMADMESLSSFDKGRKSFEGRRYKRDVEAAVDAQEKLWGPVYEENKRLARNGKKQYRPQRIITIGNHEDRINRATNDNPELDGTLDLITDLHIKKHWDTVVDYKDVGVLEGFAISHYFSTGLMGRPISGECPADTKLKKLGMSAISGHSHVLDIKQRTRADGHKMLGIVAGCYAHPEHIEGWNKNTHMLWWRGAILLNGVEDGYAEGISTFTQKFIDATYG